MADATLAAQVRNEFGKGASRRLRREHRVPAVLYGHGMDPLHLSLPGHESMLALRIDNALLEVAVEGEERPRLALVKQIQRDVIKGDLVHIDLLAVTANEKVTVEVALVIEGEAAPETTVVTDRNTIELEVPVTDIPEEIFVNVEGLQAGTQIFARDLKLPADVSYPGDPDELMVSVNHAEAIELPAEEEPAATEEEAPAEDSEV